MPLLSMRELKMAEQSAAALQVISDIRRFKIICLLHKAGDAGLRIRDLSKALDLGQSTTSHHVKILLEAGVVDRVEKGYRLKAGAIPKVTARVNKHVAE